VSQGLVHVANVDDRVRRLGVDRREDTQPMIEQEHKVSHSIWHFSFTNCTIENV
jgi:hypothetical protein